jgi:hypothetical protein
LHFHTGRSDNEVSPVVESSGPFRPVEHGWGTGQVKTLEEWMKDFEAKIGDVKAKAPPCGTGSIQGAFPR